MVMRTFSLKELAVPMMKSLDNYNFLLKSHSFFFSIDDAMAIAETWANVIDFRSEYTLIHSYTVANVADLLASYIGFSQQKRELLMLAERHHEREDGSGYPFSLTENSLDN